VTVSADHSAALVLRVWFEDATDGFRARLTTADDTVPRGRDRDVTVAVASSPGDVLEAIAAWMDRLSGDGGRPG
jgi:hypothetical protein